MIPASSMKILRVLSNNLVIKYENISYTKIQFPTTHCDIEHGFELLNRKGAQPDHKVNNLRR